ncbi:MAG TPA: MFS transporter [Candidatus Limnocylindria bacterium]|nr:MFS transporter [Candidatus Limnocylindria bacterium]
MNLLPHRFRARLRSIRLLVPLQRRDYALLMAGATVSLLGDGFFTVALAWQVYEISNVPTALSIVGVAWTAPLILFILLGGVFSDRYDRRLMMIGADAVRAAAIGLMGALSVAGVLSLWHIIALIAFVGLGDAFFNPASTAIVPTLLPDDELPQANALQGFIRPFMIRLMGPALGGFVVALAGPGTAFVIDAFTFVLSAVAIGAIATRPSFTAVSHGIGQTLLEMREGFSFVRHNPWCWATLVAAMFSLLLFIGPVQVLLPFVVKNQLGLGAESLGFIYAAGGIGSVCAALLLGQLGLPRLKITVMYAVWTGGVLLLAGYGLMTALWQALLIGFLWQALFQAGGIIWVTLLQTLVPRRLLGRVTSLDWLMSAGLVPLSYALTGPVAAQLGASATMIWGGLVGAFFMGVLLFVPGVRDPERQPVTERPAGEVAG